MAARFVVAVALFAVCSSNPVLINGVVYRDRRAYSIGQAYSNGGSNVATAKTQGNNAQAYGSSTGGYLSRDGLAIPGQAIAQAQTNDYGASKTIAQAHNGAYYTVPAPARVITYEQNFGAPAEIVYDIPTSAHAQSTAFRNGASDSSITSATSNGGIAESTANTGAGSFGATSSKAKTYGHGHAASNANSAYGATRTAAEADGEGEASSTAQNNGVVGVVYPATPVVVPAQEYAPAVIDAKTPIFHTAYVPVAPAGIASSNANVVGSGNAAASAKINYGRTISWRFGTLYDNPAGSAQAQATTYNNGFAKSHADANTNGYGSANADADVNAGYGAAKSAANVNNAGSANANAAINAANYGAARSTANTYSSGIATSTANTSGSGHAKANTEQGYYGSRTSADAFSNGYGSALSSARATPVSTTFRVGQPQAAYARANAQTA